MARVIVAGSPGRAVTSYGWIVRRARTRGGFDARESPRENGPRRDARVSSWPTVAVLFRLVRNAESVTAAEIVKLDSEQLVYHKTRKHRALYSIERTEFRFVSIFLLARGVIGAVTLSLTLSFSNDSSTTNARRFIRRYIDYESTIVIAIDSRGQSYCRSKKDLGRKVSRKFLRISLFRLQWDKCH